ncbi:hypothetical protein DFS33DRAFT_1347233 [Desarmillaria ectypa]|nr:hypothetical protein DFS33DRAFT_1347233 [Desarmillaria ectypa]
MQVSRLVDSRFTDTYPATVSRTQPWSSDTQFILGIQNAYIKSGTIHFLPIPDHTMKFSFPLLFLSAVASFMGVSAGTFVSPTPGQTICSNEPFNLTWTSDKYFKQRSYNITVLFSRSPFNSVLGGATLVEGLVSPDYGIKTYSAELTPSFFYMDNRTGAFDVVIIESYSAYAGPQYATDLRNIQTVNVV